MELLYRTRIVCCVFWASLSVVASQTTGSSQGTANAGQHLWPDFAKLSRKSTENLYSYITAIPYTYYECITNHLEVNYNGYVSFGTARFTNAPPPPPQWPFSPKCLAVYWVDSKFDSKMKSSVYLYHDTDRLTNVTRTSSLVKYVKDAVGDLEFEPLDVLAATWEDVRPKSVEKYPNDTATFQLLLATDSRVTYAIRGYHSVWKSPELATETYYSATYSRGNGDKPKIVIPSSHTGPEVIRLGTTKPNKDAYTCVEKTQMAIARLNSSLYALPPCPCYQPQAAKDQQFKTSNVSSTCYQRKSPPAGKSLIQLCCYDQYGLLIKLGQEARVPVSTDPKERSLQDAYDRCCASGSGLCKWFYYEIYQPKCASYQPAVSESELPSFINKDDEFIYNSASRGSPVIRGLAASSTHALTYSVSTVFSSVHGFGFDKSSFSWDVAKGLGELRKMSYPQRLIFYVTDTNNISAAYAPLFKLCLCEGTDQCVNNSFTVAVTRDQLYMDTFFGPDNYQSGNVNSLFCECKGLGTGRFCEKPIDACDDCLAHHTATCDSNPPDYCPSCPFGYQRRGTQCQVGDGHDICSVTRAQVWLLSILTVIASSLPRLQNSPTNHL